MTVYIEKPAVNLREELASLRNQGGYSEQQFWFENAVTNGDFATDVSGWTAGNSASLSLASNKLQIDYVSANYAFAYQVIATVTGKTYTVSATIDVLTGTKGRLSAGSSAGGVDLGLVDTAGTAEETVSLTFTATATTSYISIVNLAATGDLTVDNISAFEIDANDDVVHRLPKGWKPKDVFEDGLLQREGAAHDYEVVYDGFDYFVKPAVAPSATTQTCVIGVKA
jgi:hypothetical protein